MALDESTVSAADTASAVDDLEETRPARLPSLPKMGVSFARSMGRAVGALVTGRNPLVSDQIAEERALICRMGPCGRYLGTSDRCSACGCYVSAKVRLATESCPVGLWGPDDGTIAKTIDVDVVAEPSIDEAEEPAAAPAQTHTSEDPREEAPPQDIDEDHERVIPAQDADIEPTGITVVAYVSPRTCGACEALIDVLEGLQTAPDIASEVAFRVVDLEARPLLAKKYNIEAVPVVLLYRDAGFVARLRGYMSEAELRRIIRDIRDGLAVDEPSQHEQPAVGQADDQAPPVVYQLPTRSATDPSRTESDPAQPGVGSLEVAQSISELAWLRGSAGQTATPR